MTESTWTNSTIRKRLGECGFIQIKDRDSFNGTIFESYWQRGSIELMLLEDDQYAPELFDSFGKRIDPESLGVRNENTQTGNHP